jgi:hypothetical protein
LLHFPCCQTRFETPPFRFVVLWSPPLGAVCGLVVFVVRCGGVCCEDVPGRTVHPLLLLLALVHSLQEGRNDHHRPALHFRRPVVVVVAVVPVTHSGIQRNLLLRIMWRTPPAATVVVDWVNLSWIRLRCLGCESWGDDGIVAIQYGVHDGDDQDDTAPGSRDCSAVPVARRWRGGSRQ